MNRKAKGIYILISCMLNYTFYLCFNAVAGFLVFQITREGTYPLLEAVQLRNTPTEIKATVLSSFSQLDAIGQLISGPLMVASASLLGIQATFAFSVVLLGLAVFFLFVLKKRITQKTST